MADVVHPYLKRERQESLQSPALPPHMQSADGHPLHSYHHQQHPTASMATWNPPPAPYEGGEHRAPPSEPPPPPQHQQGYPPQQYAPQHPPPPSSGYGPDPGYSRPGSVSAPGRSPPNPSNPHYSHPPVNGAHPDHYYPPHDYRSSRPSYGPSESPSNGPPPPPPQPQQPQTPAHIVTNHEMMPPHSQPPPPGHYAAPPPSAGPSPAAPYWQGAPPADWYNHQRRKPVRAAQACDSCRQRKAKCDEGRPDCTHCKENNLKCTYRDVPPQKSEKQVMAINERLDGVVDSISTVTSTLEKYDESIAHVLAVTEASRAQMNKLMEIIAEGKVAFSAPMVKQRSRPHTKEEPLGETSLLGHQDINAPFMQGAYESRDPTNSYGKQETVESKKGRGRGPMGASDLLLWPSIKALAPEGQSVSYVMDGELNRGLLRLYGCGEGEDKADGRDGAPSPANSSASSRIDEDYSHSSPTGVWGTGGFPFTTKIHNPGLDHPGGLAGSGELVLDCKSVDKAVKSYMDRMHILHPFLDSKVLRKMVHAFKKKHSYDYDMYMRIRQSAGTKRKRESSNSPSSLTEDFVPHHLSQPTANHRPKMQLIEHSVSNAIILLVIALGKVCAYEKPLPAPVKSSTITTQNRLDMGFQGYSDLPPLQPPSSSAPPSPYTSTPNVHPQMTSSGNTNMDSMQGKNMDVIPGLAYFAKAADILGELPGGVDVSHVQANLLAGLYMGQQARIISSHFYIANACRACQILIRSAAYKEQKISPERRNLINFAFWSCLQLESDILAEIDIPESGIIEKEASMLLEIPTALTIMDSDKEDSPRANPQEFLRHYSNQIQLRRTLNDAVHNIYNAEREQDKPTKLIETIGENLENWRMLLRDWAWSDDDHESNDINQARMRGKYYGAKYIINRPALHYALKLATPGTPMSHPSESPRGPHDNTSPAVSHNGIASSRRINEMRPPARGGDQLEEWVLKACKTCVEAAIKSTTVFDKVPPRLVITNIFGTAHAQFGNVLVLSATFNSNNPQLRNLVPEAKLRELLVRTIKFLEEKIPISPALAEDANILRHVQSRLFPPAQPYSANTSFSSNR